MKVGRIDFGDGKGEVKLKGTNKHIREAIRESGKTISELGADPVSGWPYLIRALYNGGNAKLISLDKAGELFDAYMEANKGVEGLGDAMTEALAGYLHIEQTKPEDEESNAPNGGSQAEPGPSAA